MFDAMIDKLAFDYATGSLNRLARAAFKSFSKFNHNARSQINFWEEQLSPLNSATAPRAPSHLVWAFIQEEIDKPKANNANLWQPAVAVACACLLVAFTLMPVLTKPSRPAWDYVAVMHSPSDDLSLIAKSRKEGLILELEWQASIPNGTIELWAESKSDGQTRSIAVLDGRSQVQLSDANWRLIKDAHRLIATIEEEGGSATGEPSEQWVASGLCARLSRG